MAVTRLRGGQQIKDETILVDDFRDFAPSDGGGLNLDLAAGRVRDDNTITDKAAQAVALTDNATNFVEIDGVGAATANTSAFTAGKIPIARVVTSGGSISSIAGKRVWILLGAAAAGITGSGTTGVLAKFTGSTAVGDSIIEEASSKIGIGAAPSDAAQFQVDKSLTTGVVALSDGANIATDASLGNEFRVTLAGNRTLDAPTNPTNGQKAIWRFLQDATGSRTITLNAVFRLGTDITAITLTTTASKADYMGAIYNATDVKWDVIAFVKGY